MRSDPEGSEFDRRILHAHPRGDLPRPPGVPFWIGEEPSPRGRVQTGEHRQRQARGAESGTAGLTRGDRPAGKRRPKARALGPSTAAVDRMPRRRGSNTVAVEVLHPRAKDLGPALGRTAQRFLTRLDLHGTELSILLVGDGAIRQLNRRWRDIDSAPDEPGTVLGDVVISFDTAKRRAGKSKAVIVREINRYLAHGLLHLLGYDHQTPAEAREMAAMEEELLGDRGMI